MGNATVRNCTTIVDALKRRDAEGENKSPSGFENTTRRLRGEERLDTGMGCKRRGRGCEMR
jgi:hypothetical protein